MSTSFRTWFAEVNNLCTKVTGLTARDFEDYTWRDAYEDELTPGQALYQMLSDNNYVRNYPEIFEQYSEQEEIA